MGDRVVVGNNLPAQRWNEPEQKFFGKVPQPVGNEDRQRTPQVTRLADVGATDPATVLAKHPPQTLSETVFGKEQQLQYREIPLTGLAVSG